MQKNLKKNKNLILLDSGDFLYGTPESEYFKGVSVAETMDYAGYNYVVLGNHEFDYGEERLISLLKNKQFKVLGSNIVDKGGNLRPYITNFDIRDFDGVKVGIFGLITSATEKMVFPENIKDINFSDELETAKKVVEEMYSNKAQIILCLSHIGCLEKYNLYSDGISDTLIAKNVSVNVIFGGHTHRKYKKFVGKTLLLQSGSYGKYFGHLTLWVHKKYKTIWFSRNKFIKTETFNKVRPEVNLLVNHYITETSKVYDVVIGETKVPLTREKNKESSLGNLISDIIESSVKCDFAVTNSGGIRTNLPAGKIKLRDLYLMFPFENTIVYTTLTGKEIKEMFEYGIKNKYGILQVSKSVKVKILPNGELEIKIKDTPLSEQKNYVVATNSFVGSGGDGYHWFTKHKVVDTKIKVLDAIKEFFKLYSPVESKVEGRIKI